MIRTACIALVATTLSLTAQNASATTDLNGRISQIVNGLHKNAHFSLREMSFTINAGTPTRIFTGIEGIRTLNGTDFTTLNNWADQQPVPGNAFNGGYKFTHSVLGSFFNNAGNGGQSAPDNVFNGAPYQFTHEVLDSYFGDAAPVPQGASRMMLIDAPRLMVAPALAPVPEPASWAMMIGGFALVGAALRRRRATLRVA